ncbi:hypothetical protein T06_1098 [Trichinella sp. T6]|nr:hypothetical protein T06_15072 [Trichinella sp. T6]KRX69433.1 hypothetical protein T06_13673 [Trichinella sp. T6]KRX70536.1 hypothetical protein T06_1098 [Trichinella sp. T6]
MIYYIQKKRSNGKRNSLESACNDGNSSSCKRIQRGNFPELEEVLLKWLECSASNGCINRFRQRHGLVYHSVRGEAAVDVNTVINCFNKSGFFCKISDCTMEANTDGSVTGMSRLSSIRQMPNYDNDDDREQEVLPIPTLTPRTLCDVTSAALTMQRHEGPLTALAIRRRCSLQVPLRQMRNRGKKASHPVQFKNAAGEDRGWLLATDTHDRIRRYPISYCMAGRLVIDQRARRWLMIRWSNKSKPPQRECSLTWRRVVRVEVCSENVDEKTRPSEREGASTVRRGTNWRGPGGRSAGPTRQRVVTVQ